MIGGATAVDRDDAPIRAPELERYWYDRAYRQRCDAETAHARALCHAAIDAGMEPINAAQRARWAREEQA